MDKEALTPQSPLQREQGRHALVAGYIAIWALMTLLTVAALGYMSSIQGRLHDIVEIHNNKKDLIKRIHENSRERVFSLQKMLLVDDPFELESETMKLYQNGSHTRCPRTGHEAAPQRNRNGHPEPLLGIGSRNSTGTEQRSGSHTTWRWPTAWR